MRKLKVAVIGASGIGKYHVREFYSAGGDVSAILGSTKKSAEKTAEILMKEFGIIVKPYYNVDEMLKKEELDVAVISTPLGTHYKFVKKCLNAGLNVLCEKPFTEKISEAEELVKLAEKKGKIITVNTQWPSVLNQIRYDKDVSFFEMDMESGVMGKEMLTEHLPHMNSMLIKLCGNGTIENLVFDKKTETEIILTFEYNTKRKILVKYILRYNPNRPRKVSFKINEKEFIRKVDKNYSQSLISEGKEIRIKDPFAESIRMFISAVNGGGKPLISVEEILTIQKISQEIVKVRKKVAVIGAGIFGCSAALELEKNGFEVVIFERDKEIMSGASTNNHLRHHWGYHYPRSKETALESIKGRQDFEKEFGNCVVGGFPAYYALAKTGSKSTREQFLKFCDDLNLPYKIVEPDPEIFNLSEITLCIKTDEPAYNPLKLKEIIEEKIKNSNIKLKLNHQIVGGKLLNNGRKKLEIRSNKIIENEDFDFIVSAIYSNFNKINEWFGMPKETFRYDLMELLDIKLPVKEFAAMVVDGDFSTFVPSGGPGVVRLGHVNEVLIKTIITDGIDADSLIKENKESHRERIISESTKYYPILKKAKFLKSIFIVRIIKKDGKINDKRISEITDHGNGIFSIFGGKVITAVTTAKEIVKVIKEIK